ncbi:glycoside hydrolase family 78 protein [Xylariaceae sp. FL0594]|nr:glycoside hydrolase family 78 protein [Xylariaceae sp. FL0594]
MARSIFAPFLSLALLATWALGLVQHASTGSCWRDTPCNGIEEPAFPGKWDANNFAPKSRNVSPVAVYALSSGEKIASWPSNFALSTNETDVYLDFGKEVGGVITVEYTVLTVSEDSALGLAFSEAKNWVGRNSDSSNGNYDRPDGAIFGQISSEGPGTYAMPLAHLRGGFRYMTLFVQGQDTTVTINKVNLELAFQPTWSNLRAYQGYFHSNDDLLNKIWYSGAYTLQLNAIPPTTGRIWPSPDTAWRNTGVLGPGYTINIDGAKRDRTVWPGDMGVAAPASFYSTGDLESLKNSLQSLFDNQAASGLLPFSGPPLGAANSDTYHMWTMIGLYTYVLYSGDVEFVRTHWKGYNLAMRFVLDQYDTQSGLLDISHYAEDWGRFNSGGYLASAQMLFYRTLTTGVTLASWLGDETGLGAAWLTTATKLKHAVNEKLWDEEVGAFKDNFGALDKGLHPQDGNSLALVCGLVNATDHHQGQAISSWLTKNWGPLGPESPELPGEVSPFITSFEIQAHLLARRPDRALEAIRASWGWYLRNANGTQSTMVEGYLVDGSFGYRHDAGYREDYSYTSHAHGWSTGPVTALTERVLGLSVTGLAGKTCVFAPQLGDLKTVEGGFTTGRGKYRASVSVSVVGPGCISAELEVPRGVATEVVLPSGECRAKVSRKMLGKRNRSSLASVLVNGEAVPDRDVRVIDGPEDMLLLSFTLSEGGKYVIEY